MGSGGKGNTADNFRPSDHLRGMKHRIHKGDPVLGQALCGPYPARYNIPWSEVDCKNCLKQEEMRRKRSEYATE